MMLTHFKLCPFSRTVRLLLGEFALEPELRDVMPWSPGSEVLAKNPAGTLPILDTANGMTLCGSYPVAEFIAEIQSTGRDVAVALGARGGTPTATISPDLFPDMLEDRAEVRRLVDWFNLKCDREVTQEFLYEKVRSVLQPAANSTPNVQMLRAARANLNYHLDYLAFLAANRNWLGGERISLADFVAAAHLSVVDFLGEVDWDRHQPAKEWYQKIKCRPSFRPLLQDLVPGLRPPAHYGALDF
ncbi:MAG: glutathione S-transferase family protein [Hyphomicrobiaceae bacterium]